MAKKLGPEYGYNNLSLFFNGYNFNCLFCQNSSHNDFGRGNKVSVGELVSKVIRYKSITCICYFGGIPEPQLLFSLNLANNLTEIEDDRVLRFCWEWNGCGNCRLVKEAAEIALRSGGNIKFDLKSFDPDLSLAFSGVENNVAFSYFEYRT
jgi:pyruvate formate lyase activating enzyme